MSKVKVRIINQSSNPLPEYATDDAAGLDIRANLPSELTLHPMDRQLVPTGIFIELPKGYEPDNPAAEYLKLKSFVTMISLKDAELTSKELSKKVLTAFETLQPMLAFINQSIEG